MRVLMVLFALVATPFLAGVSQSAQGSNCDNGQGDEHRSAQGQAHAHKGACATPTPPADTDGDGVSDNLDQCPGTPSGTTVDGSGCAVQSSPTCAVSQVSDGTVWKGSIDGWVFNTAASWPNDVLERWCVTLTGTTAGGTTISAAALTDASGHYAFTGLPGGNYTVCEVVQSGWAQDYPSSGPQCTTGFGLSINLPDGYGWGWQNFGNHPTSQ